MNKKRIIVAIIIVLSIFLLLSIFSSGKKNDGKEPEQGWKSTETVDKLHRDNPVLYDLPYENSDFKVEYEIIGSEIEYTITLYAIYNGGGDYEKYMAQLSSLKQSALTYLSNSGVDVSKAKIKYIPDYVR